MVNGKCNDIDTDVAIMYVSCTVCLQRDGRFPVVPYHLNQMITVDYCELQR